MFKRIKPERIAGVVALSYLVLIPAAAFVAYRKIQIVEQDIDVLWDNSGMAPVEPTPIIDLRNWKTWVRLR
jgi:NADP-dependent 3-hydroxy acid dehydrogenase YdfG